MSAEDSQMLSSPEESGSELATPRDQVNTAILSPPDSQHRDTRNMPTASTAISIANSNGKRPIQTISNGNDDMDELKMMANGKAKHDQPVKIHHTSGYTWQRAEDEPGYAWMNKKALDEYSRAWDGMLHKDSMIKNRYDDPFEVVEKEAAIAASMKQH